MQINFFSCFTLAADCVAWLILLTRNIKINVEVLQKTSQPDRQIETWRTTHCVFYPLSLIKAGELEDLPSIKS